jgi:hypothetical protein
LGRASSCGSLRVSGSLLRRQTAERDQVLPGESPSVLVVSEIENVGNLRPDKTATPKIQRRTAQRDLVAQHLDRP